jgi:CRP-like cAMP-binding protein
VRTYKIFDDGRRQIGAFYFPGDLFGLEVGAEHQFSAEAIDKCVVLVVKRRVLIAFADSDGDVARWLWSFTAGELSRVQKHMLILIKSAEDRVAWPELAAWLARHSGATAEPPSMGAAAAGYAPLCEAPGIYVSQA